MFDLAIPPPCLFVMLSCCYFNLHEIFRSYWMVCLCLVFLPFIRFQYDLSFFHAIYDISGLVVELARMLLGKLWGYGFDTPWGILDFHYFCFSFLIHYILISILGLLKDPEFDP